MPAGDPSQYVLVADDEEQIRSVLVFFLEHSGYGVIACGDLAAARDAWASRADEIGLAILDLHMPDGSGLDLLGEIHARRPGLPVIIASGTSKTASPELADTPGIAAVLAKPFNLDTLEALLGELLPG